LNIPHIHMYGISPLRAVSQFLHIHTLRYLTPLAVSHPAPSTIHSAIHSTIHTAIHTAIHGDHGAVGHPLPRCRVTKPGLRTPAQSAGASPGPAPGPATATAQDPTCRIDSHVFLWRNYESMNNVFCLANPVYGMDTFIFKVNVFTNGLNMIRIPYYFPRSAYSTCRPRTGPRTHPRTPAVSHQPPCGISGGLRRLVRSGVR